MMGDKAAGCKGRAVLGVKPVRGGAGAGKEKGPPEALLICLCSVPQPGLWV